MKDIDISLCCEAGRDRMCPHCLRNAKNFPPDKKWQSMIAPELNEDRLCISWLVGGEPEVTHVSHDRPMKHGDAMTESKGLRLPDGTDFVQEIIYHHYDGVEDEGH